MLCTVLNSFGPGFGGILRRLAPVLDELVVRAELRDARAAVAVGDEIRAVGQPGDVGRPVERVRPAAAHAELALAHLELTVVREAIDHVQLVVDDPDVLLGIVRADLDLMRTAAARQLAEHRIEVLPLVDEVAFAVDDDDRVLPAAFPAARGLRLARRGDAVAVAGRIAAGRVERPYGVHGAAPSRQRQLAAHREPDSVRALGVDAAERAPGPAVVRVPRIGQRLRPVLDDAVVARRPIVIAPAAFGSARRPWATQRAPSTRSVPRSAHSPPATRPTAMRSR